jgi:transcriptional regulator with XRE-family HTH domain
MSGDPADRAFAERLTHLLSNVHAKGGKPESLRDAASGINDLAGEKVISASYLSQLKNGERTKPGHHVVAAIAAYYGVAVTYFSDGEVAARTDRQLGTVIAMRNTGVRQIALRAAGLSTESLDVILAMVENARRLEGLSEDPPPSS